VSHAFLTQLARLLTHAEGIAIFLFHRHSLFVVGFVLFHILNSGLGYLELSLGPVRRSPLELGEFCTPLLSVRFLGSLLLGSTATSL